LYSYHSIYVIKPIHVRGRMTLGIEGLVSGTELDHIYSQRKKTFIVDPPYKKTVTNKEKLFEEYGKDNVIETKTQYRCHRTKPEDEQFEDSVWCLLYEMGFSEMSRIRQCKINRNDEGTLSSNVDIFARFENYICVIECKTSLKDKIRSKNNIDHLAAIKQDSDSLLRRQFGDGANSIEIIWIYAMDDLSKQQGDDVLAKQHGIRIITKWDYYRKLTAALGYSARYQFFADIFKDREVKGLAPSVSAIQGKIGDCKFYLFSITPDELMKISFVPHMGKTDEDRLEMYQRLVNKSRLKAISQYIQDGGFFPTNIVVNFQTKREVQFYPGPKCTGDAKAGTLILPNKFRSAYIIDGQHRLFSYAGLDEAKTAMLLVIAFDSLDAAQQTDLFVDINAEQKKVSRELLNQIAAGQNWNSGRDNIKMIALPLLISEKLNYDNKSPFFNRIKLEGEKKSGQKSITYAALSEAIKKLNFFGTRARGRGYQIYPDLLFFNTVEDSLPHGISVFNNYFQYYIDNSKYFSEDWQKGTEGLLSTNAIVIPLFRLLKRMVEHINKIDGIKTINKPISAYSDYIHQYQLPVCEYFNSLTNEEYNALCNQYGEGGYGEVLNILMSHINQKYPAFYPTDVEEYKASKNKKVVVISGTTTHDQIKEIERKLAFSSKKILTSIYGEGIENWWHKGVPEKIRKEARGKAEERGDYGDNYERYLYIVNFDEIAQFGKNFSKFAPVFDIYDNTDVKKSERFSWLVVLNNIRNLESHGTHPEPSKEDRDKVAELSELFDIKFVKFIRDTELEDEWESFLKTFVANEEDEEIE
jgi:DNA sulfur modification protein DndB